MQVMYEMTVWYAIWCYACTYVMNLCVFSILSVCKYVMFGYAMYVCMEYLMARTTKKTPAYISISNTTLGTFDIVNLYDKCMLFSFRCVKVAHYRAFIVGQSFLDQN